MNITRFSLGIFLFLSACPGIATVSAENNPAATRTLILIDLRGGNDGLNMVVPFTDPAYYAARPTIAVSRTDVLPISSSLGLNPNLRPLMQDWNAHDLAVVLGVGYPDPNRSHFRSTDIWETGSTSTEILDTGWATRVVLAMKPMIHGVADGAVLNGLGLGPLRGGGISALSIGDLAKFIASAKSLGDVPAAPSAPNVYIPPSNMLQYYNVPPSDADDVVPAGAISFITHVQDNLGAAAAELSARLPHAPALSAQFPDTILGTQLRTAAELIAVHSGIPVIKVELNGFDTHSDEVHRQDALFSDFAQSIAAFRSAMQQLGQWQNVAIATYSEFGRRVAQNGSAGTDHGTAGPIFILGGSVNGGIYGLEPSLTDLDQGDLKYTTDYRSVYLAIARQWFDLPTTISNAAIFPGSPALTPLPLFR